MEARKFNSLEQTVYDTAISEGATDTLARIILAQVKHESANFSSNVFKRNNNPMGMKMPSKRKTVWIAGAGTKPPGNEGATPYARYNSLADAIHDLFNWLHYNKIPVNEIQSVSQYSELLRQRSYMGNTETAKKIYIAGLSKWMKEIGGAVSGSSLSFFLIAVILTTLILITL